MAMVTPPPVVEDTEQLEVFAAALRRAPQLGGTSTVSLQMSAHTAVRLADVLDRVVARARDTRED